MVYDKYHCSKNVRFPVMFSVGSDQRTKFRFTKVVWKACPEHVRDAKYILQRRSQAKLAEGVIPNDQREMRGLTMAVSSSLLDFSPARHTFWRVTH